MAPASISVPGEVSKRLSLSIYILRLVSKSPSSSVSQAMASELGLGASESVCKPCKSGVSVFYSPSALPE